jgi:hypothetical protein
MRNVASKQGSDAVRLAKGALGARRRLLFLVATPFALLIAGAVWRSSSRRSGSDSVSGRAPRQAAVTSVRAAAGGDVAPVVYGYTVVATYPHDRTCFTQGLQVRKRVVVVWEDAPVLSLRQ